MMNINSPPRLKSPRSLVRTSSRHSNAGSVSGRSHISSSGSISGRSHFSGSGSISGRSHFSSSGSISGRSHFSSGGSVSGHSHISSGASLPDGRVEVHCRMRPLIRSPGSVAPGSKKTPPKKRKAGKDLKISRCDPATGVVEFQVKGRGLQIYQFDSYLPPTASQGDVYIRVAKDIVQDVVDGFDATILVYGPTGAGKTYTMLGPLSSEYESFEGSMSDEDVVKKEYKSDGGSSFHDLLVDSQGIIPRALAQLCANMLDDTELHISYVEVYGNTLVDLLATKRRNLGPPGVKEDGSGNVYLENVSSYSVTTLGECMRLVERGQARRKVSATDSNHASSRSHTLLFATIIRPFEDGNVTQGTLCLADLAGAESLRGTKTKREVTQEIQGINTSLNALRECISAVSKRKTHVPYRNHTLTRVLQTTMRRDARVALILNISGARGSVVQTKATLDFGSSAKEDLIVDRVNPMNSIPNLGSHASSSGSYSVTTGAPSEVQKWKAPRTPLSIGGSLQPSSLEDKRASTETWSEEKPYALPIGVSAPQTPANEYELSVTSQTLKYHPVFATKPIHAKKEILTDPAKIKLAVCITCYNEKGIELERSLQGIAGALVKMKGVHWTEVVVFVLIDGLAKCHPSMLEYAQERLHLFDPHMMDGKQGARQVSMHLFERTVEIHKFSSIDKNHVPLQLIFAGKPVNHGKLNSHLWFFTGFCSHWVPDYCLLLDVGTVPAPDSLQKLYHAMETNPQLGGCAGEIVPRKPRLWNLVEASQVFEYKMGHILDKTFESVTGFISVLPGAFSMYRWVAITDGKEADARGEGPLTEYFLREEKLPRELGPFRCNQYLAEDRLLCFEIVAHPKHNWTTTYVKNAVAHTDIPETLLELLQQRRRWMNGSFFSLLYYLGNFPRFLKTHHSFGRRIILAIQFLYSVVNLLLSWSVVGSMMLSFIFIYFSWFDTIGEPAATILRYTFVFIYAILIFGQLLLGLMMKAQDAKLFYFAISLVYGVIMLISLPLSVLLVFNQLGEIPHLEEFVYVAAVSFGAYIAVGILHNEYITVFKSILQFLLLLPTYINVLLIYSMCNLSDIAWGTKGLADEATLRRMQEEQALMEQELMTGAYLDAAPGVLSRGQSAQSGGSSEYKGAPPPLSQVGPPISPRGPGSVFSSISRAIDLEERERRAKQLVEDMRKKTTEMEEEYNRTIKEFSQFRLRVVFIWLTFNLVYVTVIISFDLLPYWPRAIAYILMGVTGVKLIGSIWFQLERFVRWMMPCCFVYGRYCYCCGRYRPPQPKNENTLADKLAKQKLGKDFDDSSLVPNKTFETKGASGSAEEEVKVDVAQQGHSAVANGNGTPRTPGVGTGLGDDADTVLSGTTMGHRYGAGASVISAGPQ